AATAPAAPSRRSSDLNAVPVDDRPGGGGRAIGAVGAGGEDRHAIGRQELERRGERELLTPPASPVPLHRHRRLAPRDETGRRLADRKSTRLNSSHDQI